MVHISIYIYTYTIDTTVLCVTTTTDPRATRFCRSLLFVIDSRVRRIISHGRRSHTIGPRRRRHSYKHIYKCVQRTCHCVVLIRYREFVCLASRLVSSRLVSFFGVPYVPGSDSPSRPIVHAFEITMLRIYIHVYNTHDDRRGPAVSSDDKQQRCCVYVALSHARNDRIP